jgi:hypothetical protein
MGMKKWAIRWGIANCLIFFSSIGLSAQTTYDLNINVTPQPIYSGHLKLGGVDPRGDSIEVNNYYISINNKPVIPITGEFHYCRYPHQYWEESIKKIKAGGVNVISTYVFWNIHEEEEGKFDWDGDKNLREFLELCKKNDVFAIVRIGPFDHGEIRNGGLPDWLLGKPLNVRSNDSLYLFYVERLYREIGKQLSGLYYKDGGPIIGIQIENEYQHSAAPWGLTYTGQPYDFTAAERDLGATHEGVAVASAQNPYASMGNDHMKVLKSIAQKEGMITPLYTATGWGYAAIMPNESVPVTAAYAYPFWVPKRDCSPFFQYKNMHEKPDYSPVRYNPADYPSLPAELGSGISLTYSRRPVVVHKSFDAMINRCLGSGANGIGYYMYHAGSTPRGKYSYMNDVTYGLPMISYEYQSPIGEFGQVREGFHRLKLVHFFLHDFGDLLAPMTVVLPPNASTITPEDISDLRYSARVKGDRGFLFVNDFQDDTVMKDQNNVQIRIKTVEGDLFIPEKGGFNIKSGENAIFPFNFDMNGAQLKYATAQLMMKGGTSEPYFVFFSPEGTNSEFSFGAGSRIESNHGVTVEVGKIRTLVKCTGRVGEFDVVSNGKKNRVLVIGKDLALTSYVVDINGVKSLIFSDALILQGANSFEALSNAANSFELHVYPRSSSLPKTNAGKIEKIDGNEIFSNFRITLPSVDFPAHCRKISEKKLDVDLPQTMPSDVNDVFLNVDYTGDTGMGFIDGKLVADNFYNGIAWQLGLRKFLLDQQKPKDMVFYFRPMEKTATYLLDLQPFPQYIPDFGKQNEYLKVNSVSFTPQYKVAITF